MNPPQDAGTAAWIAEKATWALGVLIAVVYGANESKHRSSASALAEAKKAAADALTKHDAEDKQRHDAIILEQNRHRDYIAKLFDQLRDQSTDAQKRHMELMQRMHEAHSEVLTALNTKADR